MKTRQMSIIYLNCEQFFSIYCNVNPVENNIIYYRTTFNITKNIYCYIDEK